MPGTRTTQIPTPAKATLGGILATQNQQSIVMAGLQESAGQNTVSMTTMERNVSELTTNVANLRRLLQSDNGEQGLIFRTLMLEKGQVLMTSQMREHREEVSAHIGTVEAKLDQLTASNEEQLKEARERSWKLTLMTIGILANFVAALLLLLLKH